MFRRAYMFQIGIWHVQESRHHEICFKFVTGHMQLTPYLQCSAVFHCSLLLKHCLQQQRLTQVAVVHCSAQTNPSHILQKLGQMCMVISSNTGRVYQPKDCERLILFLKDINLPKPDKWGTSQIVAFLHQVNLWTSRISGGLTQEAITPRIPFCTEKLAPWFNYKMIFSCNFGPFEASTTGPPDPGLSR